MNKLISFLLILFSLSLSASNEERLNDIIILENNIYLLKTYITKLPAEDQRPFRKLLQNSLSILEEMEDKEKKSALEIIDNASFEKIYNKVKNTWPDKNRIEAINIALKYGKIQSEQLLKLIKLLDFDDSKVIIITKHINKITDKYNSIILLGEIKNSFKRNEVAKKLKSFTSNDKLSPIDDISFNKVYKKVKNTWPDKNKYESITISLKYVKVTSQQLLMLIQLLQHDNYKKKIILEFKDRITDKYNSYILLDEIKSSVIKKEISNQLLE